MNKVLKAPVEKLVLAMVSEALLFVMLMMWVDLRRCREVGVIF